MRTLTSLVATVSLLLTVASLVVMGGVVLALLLFFPLFVFALVGVLAGLEDHTVHQHDPSLHPRRWRDGSSSNSGEFPG